MTRSIAVLHQGSPGSDRPIVRNAWELQQALVEALGELGASPVPVFLDDAFDWTRQLQQLRPDLVVNAADLGFGYDMTLEPVISGVLEALGLPFTGSGSYANFLSSDKWASKVTLAARGVPVARCWREAEARDAELSFPVLVKMRFGHNSYGLDDTSVIHSRDVLLRHLSSRAPDAAELVIEEYVDGPEATGGFVGDVPREPLPVFTIAFGEVFEGRPKILNSATKWDASSPDYHQSPSVPADFDPVLTSQIQASTALAADALLVRDYGRVDFRVGQGPQGEPVAYVIDVNANPDLHPGAGLARMATAKGLRYVELVDRVVRSALARPPRRPVRDL